VLPYERVGHEANIPLRHTTDSYFLSGQVALKDVVWLNKNEEVNVIARYAPWDGLYMVSSPTTNPTALSAANTTNF
jgi:hypothetical protein